MREGAWDCSQCEKRGIPGGLTRCPHCNDPRDTALTPSEAPYLPTNARVVTDRDELAVANSGPEWNCGYCGSANRGNTEACAECDRPKDADDTVAATYTYVSGVEAEGKDISDSRIVGDDRTNAVLQGADPLQQLESDPVRMPDRTFTASDLPRNGEDVQRRHDDPSDEDPPRSNVPLLGKLPPVHASRRLVIIMAAVIMVVLAIISSLYVRSEFFVAHSTPLTVQNLTWERQVEVETYRTLTQSDWTVPSDGRVISSRPEVERYVQVLDHYETKTRQVPERVRTGSHTEKYACGTRTIDKGNGYFDSQTTYCDRQVDDYSTIYRSEQYQEPVYRQDPVYRTKYTYQVDRWVTDRYETARGESNPDGVWPAWPEPIVVGTTQRVGDDRKERYTVELTDQNGQQFSRSLDYTAWSYLSEGESVTGYQTKRGGLTKVDWPTS